MNLLETLERKILVGLVCVGVLVFRYAPRSVKIGDPKVTTHSNMKRLVVALEIYLSDWDDHLPPAKTTAKAQQVLFPYSQWKDVWDPTFTNGAIDFNTALAGKDAQKFDRRDKVVTFFSGPGLNNNPRWVAFLDGSTKGVTEDEWAVLQLRPPQPTVSLPNLKASLPPRDRSAQE